MRDQRSKDAVEWRRLYNTKRWQKIRKVHLSAEPLCRMCLEDGRIEPASVVDHIEAHKGNETLFFASNNLQSLCFLHHNSVKQSEERTGRRVAPRGQDGWPLDP